jgi:hypothetical protein
MARESFRSVVPVARNPRLLDTGQPIVCIGSCFVEAMGRRLQSSHLDVDLNPTGILYNPAVIAAALRRIVSGAPWVSSDLFAHAGLWRSWDHDTSFTASSRRAALREMNKRLRLAHQRIERLNTLILTFGTAFAWRLNDGDRLVANCHTLPGDRFTRSLTPMNEIVDDFAPVLDQLYLARPHLNVILTVSPVRHLRNDAHENSVSKAHLMAAAHALESRFPQLYYFPAYEIVMDELRDYRFYERDYAHLTGEAEDYIWQRFCEACLSPRAQRLVAEMAPLVRAMEHRVLKPRTDATKAFARSQIALVDKIEQRYEGLSLSDERAYFRRLLPR